MDALVAAGLLDPADAAQLSAAWVLATKARNANLLVTGRAGDSLPKDLGELAAVARVLDRPADEPATELIEEYRRVTRRARAVMERLFFGHADEAGADGAGG
jgi:glutamate-ammonia-ligase adenylyltransferase